MLAYYDERAPEYEQAYTWGQGWSIPDPEVFKAEARCWQASLARQHVAASWTFRAARRMAASLRAQLFPYHLV